MLPLLLLAVHAQTRVDPDFQRVEQTRQELAEGALSPKSRAFLERIASSARPDLSLAAIAKLQWVVELNRYPKQKLLKTIERQADVASYTGVNFAQVYGLTLGLKLHGDKILDAAGVALTNRHESPFTLTPEDRSHILTCLKANTVSGRFDALYAILPKKRLPKPDAAWIRTQLIHEAATHSGIERDFWKFVERVSSYRGAA